MTIISIVRIVRPMILACVAMITVAPQASFVGASPWINARETEKLTGVRAPHQGNGVCTTIGAEALEPAWRGETDILKLPEGYVLGRCSAVAVNSRGEVILTHRGKHPVLVVDQDGKFLRSWSSDLIVTPHGLRVDADDNVWLIDMGAHRVLKFDGQGKLLLALGTGKPGVAGNQFNQPTDVAFATDSSFYVTDGYGNHRVLHFRANGELIRTWGTRGDQLGQLHLPHSIVIDRQGRLLVGDRENNRIQIFDPEGKPLAQWPGFAPYGLAYDREGRLFVADGRAQAILRLDDQGRVVERFGQQGRAAGQFDLPHMLAFDRGGALWVAEVGNMRFQRLRRVTNE